MACALIIGSVSIAFPQATEVMGGGLVSRLLDSQISNM